MRDTFLVLSPGPYTTVQDAGRIGFQQMGIPMSGALDGFAFRIANLLVGNTENSAVLEMTILGAQLAVMDTADIAVTGAEMDIRLNYKPVPSWRSLRIEPGDMLSIQSLKSGCRAYLAVTGGVAVPEIMGSRATYVGGKMGGFRGRPLKKGDILHRGAGEPLKTPRQLPDPFIPRHAGQVLLRAVPGPQEEFFDRGLDTLFSSEYLVTAKADRMGYRLQGPPIFHRENVPKSIISEPTVPGGIQIPADNQPIILLVEQTVGGYTKIATVISADIPKIAQATPGDTVRFEKIDLKDAHRIYQEHRQMMRTLSERLEGGK